MAKKTANILFRRRRAEANPVAARKSIWVAELVEASGSEASRPLQMAILRFLF